MCLLFLLSVAVSLIVAEGEKTCICTDTGTDIYTAPNSSSSVFRRLRPGECLNTTTIERLQHWHKIKIEGLEDGDFYLIGEFHFNECSGHFTKRNTCSSACLTCCHLYGKRQTHHHSSCSHCSSCCQSLGNSSHTSQTIWSSWTPCSVTCGTGIHTRHCIEHCDGVVHSTDTVRTCHMAPCGITAVWSEWTHCSATCGTGTQMKYCIHNCAGVNATTKTQHCHMTDCPFTAVWSEWTPCSTTCGTGTQMKHCIHNCAGVHSTTKVQHCHKTDCPSEIKGSAHTCYKQSTVQAVALFTATEITHCPDQWSSGTEHFLTSHCHGMPKNTTHWIKGIQVVADCQGAKSINPYTPVGTYQDGEYKQGHHEGYSGIFISCTPNGFKMVVKACEGAAEVVDIPHKHDSNLTITSDARFRNRISLYHTIRW